MNQLLATKLFAPSRRHTSITRSRLTDLLEEGVRLGGRLSLVAAPAGFGKTTIVSEWIVKRQGAAGWLSLDEGDNDPLRFVAYLIAALQNCHAEVGKSVEALLHSSQVPALESLLITLLNDLVSLPDPLVLVLDDYHVITEPSIHHAVAFLLEHLPPQLHLVITSRIDPPLPLARLRARGHLTELRAADLRFTPEETADFLKQSMGLSLAPQEIAKLEARTEGWIAGLQLAALSMQRHSDVHAFLDSFSGSHRYILSYLAEEVLAQQTPEVQRFLLHTSILERLTAGLCDWLLGVGEHGLRTEAGDATPHVIQSPIREARAQQILEELEQRNLFLVPLDDEGRWYRYHHLFAEVLRYYLQRSNADLAELHRRASDWHDRHGFYADAVAHAFTAGDLDLAADRAERAAIMTFLPREIDPLMAWIRRLPAQQVSRRPQLSLFHAWSLLYMGNYEGCRARLRDVTQILEEGADEDERAAQFRGMVASLRTMLAGIHGDLAEALRYSEEARKNLPTEATLWRSVAIAYLGTAHALHGQITEARAAYQAALPMVDAAGDRYERLIIEWRLARLWQMEGELRRAESAFRQVLDETQHFGMESLPVAGYARMDLGALLLAQNQRRQARSYLVDGITATERLGSAVVLLEGYLTLAQLERIEGNPQAAQEAYRRADEIIHNEQFPLLMAAPYHAAKAMIFLAEGNLPAAQAWWEQHPGIARGEISYAESAVQLARTHVLLAFGKIEQAISLLRTLETIAVEHAWGHHLNEIHVCLSIALQRQGELSAAAEMLGQVLQRAVPQGYVRLFLDGGLPLAKVLAEIVRQDGPGAIHARQLLRLFDEELPSDEQPASFASVTADDEREEHAAPAEIAHWLVEPLSERELDVLRLVAKGLTNREIGDRLIISAATVKKHVENIRNKLYVTNRTEAVARARDLNLL